jgi:hypothetical protein
MPTEVVFCYEVARIDEWATRIGVPLTSHEALAMNYRRAREWLLSIKNELITQHGWRDVQPLESRLLFDIEKPHPEHSLRPKLRLRVPAHASTFFAPDRRVQWEMVFHSYAFHAQMRLTVRPINDLLSLLQCLLTGMFQLVMEENLPGQGAVWTIRALPSADWIAAHQSQLVAIFGQGTYRQLFRAAQDTRIAYKVEPAPRH